MPEPFDADAVKSLFSSLDPDVGCVVVGYDAHITYVKMTKAASYLQREGSILLVSKGFAQNS